MFITVNKFLNRLRFDRVITKFPSPVFETHCRNLCGDSDVIMSTLFNAAMMEVYSVNSAVL